jgi:hypothetical protein
MGDDFMNPANVPALPKFLTRFSWADAASMAVFFLVLVALQDWAHWGVWLALVAAFGVQVVVQVSALVIGDVRPRPVPPDLAPVVANLTAPPGKWRLRRLHPWLCTEKEPHAHLVTHTGRPVVVKRDPRRPSLGPYAHLR